MKINIIRECSSFLKNSGGVPLTKCLPAKGSDMRKVKVRKKKSTSYFETLFNNVFIEHHDIRQRCILSNGISGADRGDGYGDSALDLFYIFPIDGYQFMYSPNVYSSSLQYKETLGKFIENMNEEQAIRAFLSEVLRYDYVFSNLNEGLQLGCEVIVYGVSHYYAIRKSSINNYSAIFSI
jgi:hypothetical protein